MSFQFRAEFLVNPQVHDLAFSSLKFHPISFEPAHNAYHVLGEKVGNAFQDGGQLK